MMAYVGQARGQRLATQLQRAASSLTDQERAVLELRRQQALALKHALARDCHAIRERMKKDAEVGT